MKTKHIIIGLIILVGIIFFTQKKEHAGSTPPPTLNLSNEAIQNISKVYADTMGTVTFNNTNVTGNVKISGRLDVNTWRGMIAIWSGEINKIPEEWALCDGTKGTPDLRGRFILSQGQGEGLTNRKMGDKGGVEKHVLSVSEMPAHRHKIRTGSGSGSTPAGRVTQWAQQNDNGFKDDDIIENTGGSQPHENMPPFYVLAYIMKL